MKTSLKPSALIVVISLTLYNCGIFDGLERTTRSIERASANLAKGMDDLDPLALKKILEDNEKLRNQLLGIQTKVQLSSGTAGVIQLNTRAIKLKVASFTGSWKINSYINNPSNKIWKDVSLQDVDNRLITNPDAFESGLWRDRIIYMPFSPGGVCLPATIREDALADRINGLFRNKQREYIYPSTVPEIVLQEQLGHTNNVQMIGLILTPTKANAGNKWHITLHMEIQNSAGHYDVLKVYNFSSDFHPKHNLGKPLEEEQIFFYVEGAPSGT